jgi:hypothetical protein
VRGLLRKAAIKPNQRQFNKSQDHGQQSCPTFPYAPQARCPHGAQSPDWRTSEVKASKKIAFRPAKELKDAI